jgi:hypothetical protein
MAARIERVRPRAGVVGTPVKTKRGYELADRRTERHRNKVENAIFLRSLDEAA